MRKLSTATLLLITMMVLMPWPSNRTTTVTSSTASLQTSDTDPPVLPAFKLPYADTTVRWTGGPHQYDNLDFYTTFPAGLGSGLDFSNGTNFEVLAMAAGTIEDVSCRDSGFGCQVAVRHDVGGTVLVYAHLQSSSITTLTTRFDQAEQAGVSLWVPQGAVLGKAGNSGRQDTIHLHVELRDGRENCSYNCLPNDLAGNPLGWGKLLPVDGYVISSFLVDAQENSAAYNYDGSAVIGDFKVINDFPYYDGSHLRRAVVRVDRSFQCDSSTNCEDNAQTFDTQFARLSRGGHLTSTNILSRLILGTVLHAQSDFPILEPGEEAEVSFTLQNIGSQTWEAGHYSLVNINDRLLGAPSEQMALDVDVPSGQPVTWRFSITAPAVPDVYRTAWQFSYEGHLVGPVLWKDVIVVPGGSDDLAGIIRSLIEETLRNAGDEFEAQWEELRPQIIEIIRAEIIRRIVGFFRELCGGPATTGVLLLSVFWLSYRRSRAANKEH